MNSSGEKRMEAARKPRYDQSLVRLYGNDAGPVMWNPWNKVVQDHRDGTIHHDATNGVREALGLKVPWTPDMADEDTKTKGVFLEPND